MSSACSVSFSLISLKQPRSSWSDRAIGIRVSATSSSICVSRPPSTLPRPVSSWRGWRPGWRRPPPKIPAWQGGAYSIALVSLDLSALLRFAKRWPELEELAADTYRRFRDLGEDEEALAALKLWLDAAQARSLSEELIAEVKETVAARMGHRSPETAERQ